VPNEVYIFLLFARLLVPQVDLEFDPVPEPVDLLFEPVPEPFPMLVPDPVPVPEPVPEPEPVELDIGVTEVIGLDDGDEFVTTIVFVVDPLTVGFEFTDTLTLSDPPQLAAARLAVSMIAVPTIFFIWFSSKFYLSK